MELKLTYSEKEVFDYLKQITNLPIRAVGGWVRDKLLNLEPHDIDIAVQGCSGLELATIASQNLTNPHSIGVIQSNPNKSKHLETATTKIFEYQIDFVDLRCETYEQSSRIPQVTPGSPEEDAFRRDFCVNALFYNIQDNIVEDFTGRGISDILNRILDTPLDPIVTFSQDPLRMLRALRFSARLQFTFSQRVGDALQQLPLINRLKIVSRSRYQQELVKCFDTNLLTGIQILINHTHLFKHIFIDIFRDSSQQFYLLPSLNDWLDKTLEFANKFFVSDQIINNSIIISFEKLSNIISSNQNISIQTIKIILGYLSIVVDMQFQMTIDCVKIEHLQNANKQCKKQLNHSAGYIIPLISAVQGVKICLCVTQLQTLIFNNFRIENLYQMEPEVLIAAYALNKIEGSLFYNKMDNIFLNFHVGIEILRSRPSIHNLKEIAKRYNIVDKKLFGILKQQILDCWFTNPHYPNIGNWERDFHFIQ
ncbi:Poly(A) polymerase [Spironucleus salmonicida]|uniref:Poly(A) polymerase n=1 Tax=Spironucleus salmonicida TaxID=348837 RepID=V6LY65_9EUKA|nr:Poly(A) polymerase [Spironucleus salmonicida]|eukprot:EST45734.1 tRNA-nucleotidyltransferase [Spironucleus salmonicida]